MTSSIPSAAAPPPESPSTITDGAVNGKLPATEAFSVHYPGYPSSPARAAHTLGGLPAISKVRTSDPGSRLELRFRPEDPDCHPTFGEPRASTGLLLRLSRPKGGSAPPRAEVVARVRTAYHFEGMADFQHVVPVHAAQVRKRKRLDCPNVTDDLGTDKAGGLDTDDGDVMMLVPPLFSIKDNPTNIALLPSSNALSKSMQRGVVQHRWEMDIEPTLALPFNIQAVPKKINWEDHIPRNSSEWDSQMAVCKLFDERPVWPRQSLYERLLDDGVHVSTSQFKSLLFKAGYYFSTGPFGKFWIKKEYDPRKDPESRIYQRIDFRMPPELRVLQTKRHGFDRCQIPFEEFHQLLERSKKQEAICRSEPLKEIKDVDEEAPAEHVGPEDQMDTNNSDSEDVDDEEEEDKEESDGYGSPAMAEDVPDFTLHESYGNTFLNLIMNCCHTPGVNPMDASAHCIIF